MVLTIDYKLFKNGVRRVVVKGVKRGVPWREYVLDWSGLVKELECSTAVNSFKLSIDVVCREIGGARKYVMNPILVIENDNGVLTALVGD
jgi:hypothetical protein